MKEKTKKIMAGLGIGLALATGGTLMTGCSDVMTKEQMDKVLTVVDNSDKFMNETLDLLQENNKILDGKAAVKLYNWAMNRLHLNYENVWDNLKITMLYNGAEGFPDKQETYYYKLSSGVNVLLQRVIDGSINYLYGYHDSTQEAGKIVHEQGEGQTTTSTRCSFEYYAYKACTGLVDGMYLTFTEDDVVSCKVNDNNNYVIVLAVDDFMESGLEGMVDIEITQEGYLNTIQYTMIQDMPIDKSDPSSGMGDYSIINPTFKYEYGVLTEAEVQANIDAYNAQD